MPGDMSKRQFNANHAQMLQQKHDNTIKNIQELQELEKYMFQNLQNINKSGSSAASEAAIIQTRINELSAMRQNLFLQLKNLYTNVQSSAAGSRGDLADQIAVVEIVEKELSGARANLNQLVQERDNKLRMVEIGNYTSSRYSSHKDILKKIVYGIVVVILITILMSFSWFPRIVGTIGIIFVIAVTLGLIGSELMDNYNRSNLVWSQFEQPFDKDEVKQNIANAAGGGLSIWEQNKQQMASLYDSAKSQASSGLTAVADGSASADLQSKVQGIADQAQASGGQVQASPSPTSEGFAPFN
jgi:hypothetical protein